MLFGNANPMIVGLDGDHPGDNLLGSQRHPKPVHATDAIVDDLTGSFVGSEHFLVSNLPISQAGVGGVAPPPGFIPDEPIEIRVDIRGGRYVASAGKITTDDPATLATQLERMRKDLNKAGKSDDQIQVKIAPGRNVKYQFLVKVYEAALGAGYRKVAFTRSH